MVHPSDVKAAKPTERPLALYTTIVVVALGFATGSGLPILALVNISDTLLTFKHELGSLNLLLLSPGVGCGFALGFRWWFDRGAKSAERTIRLAKGKAGQVALTFAIAWIGGVVASVIPALVMLWS